MAVVDGAAALAAVEALPEAVVVPVVVVVSPAAVVVVVALAVVALAAVEVVVAEALAVAVVVAVVVVSVDVSRQCLSCFVLSYYGVMGKWELFQEPFCLDILVHPKGKKKQRKHQGCRYPPASGSTNIIGCHLLTNSSKHGSS